MIQTKRNQEKWLSLKYAFIILLKQKRKIKVCMMENKSSVAKIIKMRGNNSILTSKLQVLLNISAPCWQVFMGLL